MTLTKNFLFVFSLATLLLASCSQNSGMVYNVRDYGAKNDKSVLSTRAIQKAIDQCYNAGGGKVYFPAGEYLAGTIVLKSNVILYLEAGATLFASQDTMDYKSDFKVIKSNDSGKPGAGETPVFIYAKNANNIGIMGKGTIHGQAQRTWEDLHEVDGFIAYETENARLAGIEMKRFYKVHPYICLVFLEECENVTISDVSLIESTDWTLHFKWCNRVFVDNVYIESSLEAGVNSDGIDIDGCTDVVVSNCIITTGDDAIVLKSTMTYPDFRNCENITVINCALTSTSTGLKIGTESHGDFKNVSFSNCVITNSNRGLSIVVRDGGTVENIMFSDIIIETNRKHFNWWGNGDPVWLVLKKRRPESKLGMIRNVSFNNIIAHGQGTSKVEGFPGQPLENIRFSNVQLHMHPESLPDKRADDAFFASEIKGLTLENVSVTWNGEPEPAWRHAFSFANIHRLHLNGLQGTQAPTQNGAFIVIKNVEEALIERCWPANGTGDFLLMDGPVNRSITLNQNHLQGVNRKTRLENGARVGELSGN